MRWSHRLVVLWTVAITLHMPMPVSDGDGFTTGACAADHQPFVGIDFVLLGCDLPDDCDEGPIDDDPESGSSSALGSIVICVGAKTSASSAAVRSLPTGERVAVHQLAVLQSVNRPRVSVDDSRLDFSYGKCCQSGLAVLRC